MSVHNAILKGIHEIDNDVESFMLTIFQCKVDKIKQNCQKSKNKYLVLYFCVIVSKTRGLTPIVEEKFAPQSFVFRADASLNIGIDVSCLFHAIIML